MIKHQMNEQQLAAVKQALEALQDADHLLDVEGYSHAFQQEAITALQSIISQDALDKKAENARELGLSYDTPLSRFARSNTTTKD